MKINWLDHLVNLIVVIVGITIAFYMESHKEEKASRKQEKQYLVNLVDDLEYDKKLIDTLVKINDGVRHYLSIVSSASIDRPYPKDSLRRALLGIQYNPPFISQATTYESLKSSGKLDLISDFKVRTSVVELYERYYKGMRQYDDEINAHTRDFVKPHFMDNVVFKHGNKMNVEALQTSRFANIIFSYEFLYQGKSDFYKEVKSQLDSVLYKVKRHQKKR